MLWAWPEKKKKKKKKKEEGEPLKASDQKKKQKKKKKKKKKEGKPLKCSDQKIKQNNNSNERSHWKVLGMTIALIVVMASLGYTYVQTDPIVHINYVQFFVN